MQCDAGVQGLTACAWLMTSGRRCPFFHSLIHNTHTCVMITPMDLLQYTYDCVRICLHASVCMCEVCVCGSGEWWLRVHVKLCSSHTHVYIHVFHTIYAGEFGQLGLGVESDETEPKLNAALAKIGTYVRTQTRTHVDVLTVVSLCML